MQSSTNPAMINKIDTLGKIINAQPIFSECQPRESDGVVFYHIAMISEAGLVLVLGVNYKNSYGFFISDKLELNDMVDLVHTDKDIFYLSYNENDNVRKINV